MNFAQLVEGRIVPAVDAVIIPLIYAITFVFFLIGAVKFFFSQNDTERKQGRDFVLWSVIAFAVMFSVWGLVRLLLTLLV